MQTAAGDPLRLTPAEQKYLEWSKMTPEQHREYRINRAKAHLQSGPNITNFWEAFQTYIGNRDPENPNLQTGDVPNPGMRNPKQVIGTVQKAKSIAERAAKLSDKVFDRQYQRVISSGNPKRVQAVRDLHFRAKSKPVTDREGNLSHNYHATKAKFNSFDLSKAGSGSGNKQNTEGVVYFTPYKEASIDVFHPKTIGEKNSFNVIDAYLHNPNPIEISLEDFTRTYNDFKAFKQLRDKGTGIIARAPKTPEQYFEEALKKYNDAVKSGKIFPWTRKPISPEEYMEEQLVDNITINKPEYIKSAQAITYDNNGNIIPISQRDNFLINDIRYKQGGKMNILEFLKNGSKIHIKAKNKGKFTKSAKAAGQSVQEHAKSVLNDPNATPLQKKRANFARNAAKWKHKEGGTVKAQEGTKFNWGSAIGNLASTALQQGVSTYVQNKKLSSDAEAEKERYKSEAASKLQKDMQDERIIRFNILNAIKGTSDNPNAFGGIFESVFINQGDNEAIRNYNQSISDYNKMIDQQVRARKAEGVGNFLSSLGQQGVGLLANSAFNKNSPASTNVTSSTNTSTINGQKYIIM